ncbi:hypothetical protein Scep_012036 [Stephania cephalantha]|uniref:Uncharacterized protein n=1 Tax=Stephania cephalantha TaxID=152367 RepID=A0AAP0JEF4_9MAGN
MNPTRGPKTYINILKPQKKKMQHLCLCTTSSLHNNSKFGEQMTLKKKKKKKLIKLREDNRTEQG